MTVTADDVTIRGLEFRNVATSYVEDRAAIKVQRCDRLRHREQPHRGRFLRHLSRRRRSTVASRDNRLHARARARNPRQATAFISGRRTHITIEDNEITGHRDGIYLEFVHESEVRDNVSANNLRYGMHFMYSDDCRYIANTFRHNGSGVAVMYTKRVVMIGNRFEDNWGARLVRSAAQGDQRRRTCAAIASPGTRSALLADGATRLVADGNEFTDNGWAVKLLASTQDGRFTSNNFVGNTFDVATNSRETTTSFAGNYWDDYRGYDLNRDGIGDVPHHPVRLFSLLVAQNEPALDPAAQSIRRPARRSPSVCCRRSRRKRSPMRTPAMQRIR